MSAFGLGTQYEFMKHLSSSLLSSLVLNFPNPPTSPFPLLYRYLGYRHRGSPHASPHWGFCFLSAFLTIQREDSEVAVLWKPWCDFPPPSGALHSSCFSRLVTFSQEMNHLLSCLHQPIFTQLLRAPGLGLPVVLNLPDAATL